MNLISPCNGARLMGRLAGPVSNQLKPAYAIRPFDEAPLQFVTRFDEASSLFDIPTRHCLHVHSTLSSSSTAQPSGSF
jgi:hypothetical protein